jgi:hypothetical protein
MFATGPLPARGEAASPQEWNIKATICRTPAQLARSRGRYPPHKPLDLRPDRLRCFIPVAALILGFTPHRPRTE